MGPKKKDEALTPTDLDPVFEMHKDLKNTLNEGLKGVSSRLDTYNNEQIAIKTKLKIYEKKQDKHEFEIEKLKLEEAGCPARTGWDGVNREVGELNSFKEEAHKSGVFAPTSSEPSGILDVEAERQRAIGMVVTNPLFIDKVMRYAATLLMGAAIAGALLAATGKITFP